MFKIKNVLQGVLHAIIAFPAIVVVTGIIGLNLPNAFFFAGVCTLLFHLITKNKLPVVLGVSGAYIGAIIGIASTIGVEYVTGAVFAAGLTYIVLGVLSLKWQEKIMSFFPSWMLNMAIILIGLSLLPIGQSIAANNLLVAFVALIVAIGAMFSNKKVISMSSMMIGIIAATLFSVLMYGIPNVTTFDTSLSLSFGLKFNFGACLQMTLLSLVTYFEMLGDCKNTGEIIGMNVFEEVGVGKIAIANGLSQLLAGSFGANAYTTYSENAGALFVTKHFDPWAQVWSALTFIIISFIPQVFTLISYIPMAAFGGMLLFLYGVVTMNAVKQMQTSVDLNTDFRVLIIIAAMLSISFIPVTVFGVTISGTATALIFGLILNKITEPR